MPTAAGGCSQPGLSAASAQDKASVLTAAAADGEVMVDDPACQVDQVSAPTGPECAATTAPGWCYVDGACANVALACDHAVCTTPAFDQLFVMYQLRAGSFAADSLV
jgi:hypothetical protein